MTTHVQTSASFAMRRLLITACLLAVLTTTGASAAPAAELWPRWQAHDNSAEGRIDHAAWGRFLERYHRSNTSTEGGDLGGIDTL